MKCIESYCAREAVVGSYCAVHAPKPQFLPGHSPAFDGAGVGKRLGSAEVGTTGARNDDAPQGSRDGGDGTSDRTG